MIILRTFQLVSTLNLLLRYEKFKAFDNIFALHYGQFLYPRMKSRYKHASHVLTCQFRER